MTRGLALAVWLLSRSLWLLPLGAFTWLLLSGAAHAFFDPLQRANALALLLPGLILMAPFVFFLLQTRAILAGSKPYSERELRSEAGAMLFIELFIGLLLAVSYPYFKDLVRKSIEGTSRGRLVLLRQALDRRPAKQPPPATLEGLLGPGELAVMPELRFYKDEPHPRTRESVLLPDGAPTDSGRWGYAVGAGTATIIIDCTHTDLKGRRWDGY